MIHVDAVVHTITALTNGQRRPPGAAPGVALGCGVVAAAQAHGLLLGCAILKLRQQVIVKDLVLTGLATFAVTVRVEARLGMSAGPYPRAGPGPYPRVGPGAGCWRIGKACIMGAHIEMGTRVRVLTH